MSFMSFIGFAEKPRPAEKIIRVRITRSTTARLNPDEDLTDLAKGDVVELRESEALALCNADAAQRLCEVGPDGTPVPASKPAPAKPAPVALPAPADFATLPKCFVEAWDLQERRRLLGVAIAEAIEAYLPGAGKSDFTAIQHSGDVGERHLATKAADVEKRREILRDFDAKEGGRMFSALTRAGASVLEKTTEANRATLALEAVALEIFGLRVAALELAPDKVRSLFQGSGLALRYSRAPINPPPAKSLGYDRGDALDLPLPTLACLYRLSAERLAEAETLLVQARAELAAAERVTGEASAPAKPAKRAA